MVDSGNLRSHAYCNSVKFSTEDGTVLATCVHMRIATIAIDHDAVIPSLATCVHMRIATLAVVHRAQYVVLATCVHMRIATGMYRRRMNYRQTGNLRSHAYCNGKNAQYYNTQSL